MKNITIGFISVITFSSFSSAEEAQQHFISAEQFPKSVAGFAFGISASQMTYICNKNHFSGVVVDNFATCSDAISFPVKAVVIGNTCPHKGVCEYMLMPSEAMLPVDHYKQIYSMLDSKYGAPTSFEGDVKNTVDNCKVGQPYSRINSRWWFVDFSQKGKTIGEATRGQINLVLFCSEGKLQTTLFYENTDGVKNRIKEYNKNQSNY